MVSSDVTASGITDPIGSFNASIGRWCLQTRPVVRQPSVTASFNASIGRWCLQTSRLKPVHKPLNVSMPQSADGVFRLRKVSRISFSCLMFQCLNRQMVSSDQHTGRLTPKVVLVSMPQSADGVFRQVMGELGLATDLFQCLNRQMVSSDQIAVTLLPR